MYSEAVFAFFYLFFLQLQTARKLLVNTAALLIWFSEEFFTRFSCVTLPHEVSVKHWQQCRIGLMSRPFISINVFYWLLKLTIFDAGINHAVNVALNFTLNIMGSFEISSLIKACPCHVTFFVACRFLAGNWSRHNLASSLTPRRHFAGGRSSRNAESSSAVGNRHTNDNWAR